MGSTIGLQNLILALQQALIPSSYQGVVGIGSAADSVVDALGGFGVNQWANWGIQFASDTATAALRNRWQQIVSNTGTTHALVAALPAVPAPGDTYNIRPFGQQVMDLQAVGGTAQTGADWTPLLQTIGLVADAVVAAGAAGTLSAKARRLTTDLASLLAAAGATADAAVTDPAVAASIVAALKGILTDLGQAADAVVDAGAVGSLSAKLRRATADLGGVLTAIGTTADAAVTDPALAASVVAALKGLLTDLGQAADALVAAGAVGSASAKLRRLSSDIGGVLAATGTTADAAVTDPAVAATLVAALKGLLTDLGQNADALVDAGAVGSVSAKLRRATSDLGGLLTAAGTTADAAVTDPALAATLVSALKGILTDLGQIADAVVVAGATGSVSAKLRRATADLGGVLLAAGTTADAAVADPAVAASIIAAIKGVLTDIGQTTDAAVAAGAVGSVSAKLRRLSTDLVDTLSRNMAQIGGTAQTGQDWTLLLRAIANTSRTMQRIPISVAAAGDTVLIAAVADQRHKIVEVDVQNPVATDNTVIFKDGAVNINGLGWALGEKQGWSFEGDPGRREWVLEVNTAFNINLSAATQISGFVLYYTEA